LLKNGPRGKSLQERSYHKKLSNTPLIYGDSFILLYKNMKFLLSKKNIFVGTFLIIKLIS